MSRSRPITTGYAMELPRQGRQLPSRDADFYAWTIRQSALLREGHLKRADISHVAEEIEDLGKAQRQELGRRIRTILEHLFKLDASPARNPRAGWRETVRRTRRDIAVILRDSPSLRSHVADLIAENIEDVRQDVADSLRDRGEDPSKIAGLSYSMDQVLGRYMPEQFIDAIGQ